MKAFKLTLVVCICISTSISAQRKSIQHIPAASRSGGTYSPSQGYFAVALEKKVSVYSTYAYDKINDIGVAKLEPNDVAFAPDGKSIAIAYKEDRVDIWDHINVKMIVSINTPVAATGVEYLDDDRILVMFDTETAVYSLRDNASQPKEAKAAKVFKDHDGLIRSISVSADGKLFATAGEDGIVNVYNSVTLNSIIRRKTHDGFIRAVAISPDKQLVVAGDSKGVVNLMNVSNAEVSTLQDVKGWIRSLSFSDDGKYLAIGSDKGSVQILDVKSWKSVESFKRGMSPVVSLDFSPDGTRLASGEQTGISIYNVVDLYISPANQLNNKEDRTPPQILVSSPPNINDDRVILYKDIIEVRGTLIDDYGVRSLRINSVEVPLKENNNFVTFLPLTMGNNSVTIEALDVNNNIALRKFTIVRKNADGEDVDIANSKNYLVAIGIDEYDTWPKLGNAVKDANDVASVLISDYNFKFDNVTMLKNEQATRANIYKSLRSMIERITPNDNLMIYYSGHGYFDQVLNEGYWIPVEADVNSTGEYLSNSDILKLIANINSRHTFLVADACFSGSLFGDTKRGYADNVERFRSRWGLASGRLEVVSDGTAGQNSPFASAVLEFLRNNTKSKLAISELVQYVKIKVAETSDQTPLGNPLKVTGDEGGELVLYKK